MAQVPSNMTKAVHHSQGYLAMRSGLKEIFVHKFNQHFSKLAFNKAQGGLLILKTASTKTVKRHYRNALESLSLRQQRAVYWIDSLLLFWTVTLEKPSFLPYLWHRRKSNWQSSSGEWRLGGSEKGEIKRERAAGLA